MKLQSLDISDFRNIRSAKLQDFSQLNLLYGDNGAGKTSVLEAIHCLAMARSFRSARTTPLINADASLCRVFARVQEAGRATQLGVERRRQGGFTIKINAERATSAAALAQQFPVRLLNADSFKLLLGAPKERREFVDWGVFHVKQGFLPAWQRTRRALKQRNSLLRQSLSPDQLREQLAPWDGEIAQTAVAINQYRRAYLDDFMPVFLGLLRAMLNLDTELSIDFKDGWPQGSVATQGDYLQILQDGLLRDLKMGSTQYGPQRADLVIKADGMAAADVLSRGQQKILVCALVLAQCQLFEQACQRQCVLLADDIPAEIDEQHQRSLFEQIRRLGLQCFMTSTTPQPSQSGVWAAEELALFHVKQGSVERL